MIEADDSGTRRSLPRPERETDSDTSVGPKRGHVPPPRRVCFQASQVSINQCSVGWVFFLSSFSLFFPSLLFFFTAPVTLSVLAESCDALR